LIIIENISYENYIQALENKEVIRKSLLDIRFQIAINKFNQDILNELTKKEQELVKMMRKNFLTIKSYELENNIERGIENDKHKGK